MISPDDMHVNVIVKTEKGMFGKCMYAYTYICIVTKDREALNLKESEELCV